MNWPTSCLGEIVKLSKGKKHRLSEIKTSTRYIQVDDLRNDNHLKYTEDENGTLVDEKDVVIVWDGSVGIVGYRLKGFIGSTLARLTIDNPSVDAVYLAMFLQSRFKEIKNNRTGTTIPHVSRSHLLSMQMPTPPLEEQRRIVAILEEAFAGLESTRANAEANLNNADEVFRSSLTQCMDEKKAGWEVKQLGEVCTFQRGLTYSKKEEALLSSNPVLRANNVSLATGQLDLSEIKYVSDELNIPKTKRVMKGSLLVCTASGSKAHLGKAAIIEEEIDYAFGGFMGLLIPGEFLNPKYLWHICNSGNYKIYIESLSAGTNINNLRWQQLSEYEIPLPSLEEQQRIVGRLDALKAETSKLKEQYQTQLADIADLRQSLLQKAFAGELT